MRYYVYLPRLVDGAEQIDRAARGQRQALEDVRDTARKLGQLWGMEGVIAQLHKKEREMEEELYTLLKMAQALRRICRIYLDMENAIIDRLDFPFHLDTDSGSPGAADSGSPGINVPAPPPPTMPAIPITWPVFIEIRLIIRISIPGIVVQLVRTLRIRLG